MAMRILLPSGYSHVVEKSKLDEDTEREKLLGLTEKPLNAVKKDLTVSKRNCASGSLDPKGFISFALTQVADADQAGCSRYTPRTSAVDNFW
ncbi:hypothetical protein Tco_0155960 [Tanacetum coccineum]